MISLTNKQLQTLVDQTFEHLYDYVENAEDPQAKPLYVTASSLDEDLIRIEDLVKFHQGGFLFGRRNPKVAYELLERYLDLWTWDYARSRNESQLYEDPIILSDDELPFLTDIASEIKRLGFDLVDC